MEYVTTTLLETNFNGCLFVPDIPKCNVINPQDISLSLTDPTRSLTSTAALLALQRIKDATL
ncbi:hypothetical protein NQ314_013809 [Rhamnusium bicolor]|uniref:Uncharacterized protein n=1 Tax=Rhamnusium bicolor TaxID=1586634 RepID=A0AAV8X558_9CUCU|nr:hypothetical protein NQ314_013809 [Rhamnusium bicolor]